MSLKRRIIARLNHTSLIDGLTYTAKHGPARGLRRRGGMGWLPSLVPRIHEWGAEEAFIEGFDWSGLTVYDVGGDQGIFTLFFAQRVGETGHVVVFEPNRRSCLRIRQNVELNGFRNVRVLPYGLGERQATLQFTYPLLEPARGTAAPAIADQIKLAERVADCVVEINSLDEVMGRDCFPVPQFIKMDVEGMEYAALRGMERTLRAHRPRLSIEIHGASVDEKVGNVRRVVAFLEGLDYRIRHIESGQGVGGGNAECAFEGHLYCEAGPVKF